MPRLAEPPRHLLHCLPLAGPYLPRTEDRLCSPLLVFCWVQRKGSDVWRRPSPRRYYAGGNTAGRGVAGSLLVSLSTKAQHVCRAGHVKPRVPPGVLPLSKNLISTFKISPSSSLPFIRMQAFSRG